MEGTFGWKPLAVWEMLFCEWHLDYRGALFTITVNTSFITIALLSLGIAALRIKKVFQQWCGFLRIQSLLGGIFSGFRRQTRSRFKAQVCFVISTVRFSALTAMYDPHHCHLPRDASPPELLLRSQAWFQFRHLIKNIHWQLSLQHLHPLLSFLSPVLTQTSIFLILEGSHIAPVTHFKCISD